VNKFIYAYDKPKVYTQQFTYATAVVTHLCYDYKHNKVYQFSRQNRSQLEIWGKAQCESARCPKSDWGENTWR